MPILTKAQLEALNQASFPDQSTEAITPQILREYNTSTIDSLVDSLATGSFTTDAEFNAFTQSQNTKDATLATYTGSVDTKFNTIGSQSGSWINTALNTFTASQDTKNATLATYTGSNDTKWNTLGGQTGSYVTSAITASSLVTASFNNGTRNLTFTKGDTTTFAVNIPDASGSATINTGSFATTGSNNFIGDQTITGSVNLSGAEHLFIKRSNTGANQLLRLGATDNENNFAFIVTGSDTNPGQQVWGINTAGGIWNNSFDGGVVFNSFVTASFGLRIQDSGTFSAPLQQGYAWVGDSTGRTNQVPTSSFGGGTIVGYATTASNTFYGDQTINGSNTLSVGGAITANSGINVLNGSGIGLSANIEGSGSSFTSVTSTIDVTSDPTNVYSAFQLIKPGGEALIAMAANSYTAQYPNTTIPILFGGGNNPGGDNSGIAFPTNGNMDVWKKTIFNYGINVTGSTQLGSFTSSLQQGYAFVGGANGRTTTVPTSSFGGGSTINTGSFATTGSNNFTAGQTILNGGGIDLKANIQGSGSSFTSVTSTIDVTSDPTNVYSSFQLIKPGGDTLIAMAANSYTSEYSGITIPYLFGGGNNPGGTNTGIAFPTNGQMDVWKKSNFKYGVDVTGSANISGSLNISGSTSTNNTITITKSGGNGLVLSNSGINSAGTIIGNNGLNLYGGGGIGISANAEGSGSAYASITTAVDVTSDPTNVFSAYQLVKPGGEALIGIAANSYTAEYSGITIPYIFGGGNNPGGTNAGIAFPTNGNMDVWKKTNFKYPATFTTGSNNQAGTATLNGGNPGTVTVSNSSVTANSIIMVSKQTLNHPNGYVAVSAKSAGSFTITSNHNGDADIVGWFIINNS